MRTNWLKALSRTIKILLYFCIVAAVFTAITLLTSVKTLSVGSADDLRDFNYSTDVAYISPQCFDWYLGELYTPDDFTAGRVGRPSEVKIDDGYRYCSYRLVTALEQGEVYGLSAYSATYSQKIWVDGKLLSQVGTPGRFPDEATPKTDYFTVYFTAQSPLTEIVIQRSDFVHAAGGSLYPQYLGRQDLVTRLNEGFRVSGSVMVGSMLTAALFFFGIFLFFQRRLHFLWFSLACLMISLRTMFTDHKLIMTLLPGLEWQLSHRIEYVATVACALFFFLYVSRMFAGRLPRALAVVVYSVYGLSILVTLFLPSDIYTRFLPLLQYGIIASMLAVVFFSTLVMLRDGAFRGTEHICILLGTVAVIALTGLDLARYNYNGLYEDLNLTQTGMTVFVFANTLALALSFTRTEVELAETRQKQRENEEALQLLNRLNRLKSDFLANITHEMKTPLTVMSGYAQLTRMQLDAGMTDDETKANLTTISMEARRLADLAGQLLDAAAKGEGLVETGGGLFLADITTHVQAVFEPMLLSNGNRFVLDIEPGCPAVSANADMLMQVLMNLLANASRHTKDGRVTLSVGCDGDMVAFRVADNGDGIPSEMLPQVFERGKSGDGQTGLGLSICRETVEALGGTISIESQLGKGTSVSFTLPTAGKIDGEGC